MKIFISTPWFSPAVLAGGPVQSLNNLVSRLSGRYVLYIYCAAEDLDGTKLPVPAYDRWIPYGDKAFVFYHSAASSFRNLASEIKSVNPDCLFITGIYSPLFTLVPLLFGRGRRIIVSPRGMLHPPALARKRFKKSLYLLFLKQLMRIRNAEFHATDESEKKHVFSRMGPNARIFIAPNFPTLHPAMELSKEAGRLRLITVALIGPMKNHLEVLTALSRCTADIEYEICGPVYDRSYWEKCLAVISRLPSNIKVTHTGLALPQHVIEHLSRAHVFICPSRSENYGHAIIEALSAGKPVITSHHTPWNFLEDRKAGMNVEPEPSALAAAIGFFAAMNQPEYDAWEKGACAYARTFTNPDEIHAAYRAMFGPVAES